MHHFFPILSDRSQSVCICAQGERTIQRHGHQEEEITGIVLGSELSFPHLNWKRKKESEVAQSCPTLCDPMDCSLPGSSVHGIFQARILKWAAISFSRSKLEVIGNFLAVQWLGLHAFIAEGLGSIHGQGTKIAQTGWWSHRGKKKRK